MAATAFHRSLFTEAGRFVDTDGWHGEAARLRQENPVLRVVLAEGFPDFWAILKHSDILEILKHPDVFANTLKVELRSLEQEKKAEETGTSRESLLHMDAARNRKYRDITSDWFTSRTLHRAAAARIAALARESVDRMADLGGSCEFVGDIARHLPLRVIMSTLGVPPEDEPHILSLALRVMMPEDPGYAVGDAGRNKVDAVRQGLDYFGTLAGARRRRPADDLASVIANATVDGSPPGDRETASYFYVLAAAGHETTSATMAAGLEALVQNPDQLRILQQDPALVPGAVEEILRWATPVKQLTRTAVADHELRGVT